MAPALGSNRILQLAAGADGTLWILSEQGHLSRYAEHLFHAVAAPADLDARGRQMALDSRGTLWLATGRGLFRVAGDRLAAGPRELADQDVRALATGAAGRLWLALADGRLALVEGGELAWLPQQLDPAVISLVEDAGGVLWVGTSDGLWRWDGAALSRVRDLGEARRMVGGGWLFSPPSAVRRPALFWQERGVTRFLQRAPRGELWELAGTSLLRAGRAVAPSPELGPRVLGAFRALTFGRGGMVWIATADRGLHALRPTRVAVLGEAEGLVHGDVRALHQDRQGSIWIGDAAGGLSRIRATGGGVAAVGAPSHDKETLAIYDDPGSGLLLVGTPRGLYYLDGNERLPLADVAASPAGGLDHGAVRALHRTRDGRLLVGHEDGLWESRRNDPQQDGWRLRRVEGSAGWRVRALVEDKDGTVWLGTQGDGLAHYRDGRLTVVTTAEGLSSDRLQALHLDPDGYLWIAIEDRGLNRLDPATSGRPGGPEIAVIRERDGLWDDALHRILEDEAGWLWISTRRGIFRVRRAQLDDFIAGRVGRVDPVAYTERDGMPHREANGGVQDAGFRAGDGRLWLPTRRGVAILDPPSLVRQGVTPPIHLESLTAGAEDLSLAAGAVTLGARQRSFEIAYTALAFREPGRLKFRYRLEGYQEEWIEAGSRRRASFTRVPAGRYTFHLKARSSDGVWNREGARLAVTVRPFFWETPWFRVAGVLLLAAAVAAGLRWRERRHKTRHRQLEAEVARLMDDCHGCWLTLELERQRDGAARRAGHLAELEHLKSELFADVSHEFRTPLTLILGPLRDVQAGDHGAVTPETRRQLELANRSAERLVGLVDHPRYRQAGGRGPAARGRPRRSRRAAR